MRILLIAAAAAGATALAAEVSAEEAGSVGGAIGKQGRSASGNVEKTEPARSAPGGDRGASATEKQRQGSGSVCAKLVGVWLGPTNTDMIFKADRTVTSPDFSDAGPWSCNNGQVVITWKQWGTDRCTLSAEGTQMTCTNTLIGNSFNRSRKSGG
jgi:hypothetical protein